MVWEPSSGQQEMGNQDSSCSTLNVFCLTCSTFPHEVLAHGTGKTGVTFMLITSRKVYEDIVSTILVQKDSYLLICLASLCLFHHPVSLYQRTGRSQKMANAMQINQSIYLFVCLFFYKGLQMKSAKSSVSSMQKNKCLNL